MKMWILAMAMMVGFGANAQEQKKHREHFTQEQRAELKAKKMTLALDLNQKQQKDMKQLLIENGKQRAEYRRQHMAERHSGKNLTADERFAMKSKKLDDRIAMRAEMKKILSDEQFSKLENMRKEKRHELRKRERTYKNHNRR